MKGPNKLECQIILGWTGLLVTTPKLIELIHKLRRKLSAVKKVKVSFLQILEQPENHRKKRCSLFCLVVNEKERKSFIK
jgi:hypothetical protein